MASIKDLKRMCKGYSDCDVCPLKNSRCHDVVISLPDNADEIVDKWVQEHPVKTYADDFFEKFPNAPRDRFGAPMMCMHRVYNIDNPECGAGSCSECWNQEMKEGAEK